jgi:DNA processing protein
MHSNNSIKWFLLEQTLQLSKDSLKEIGNLWKMEPRQLKSPADFRDGLDEIKKELDFKLPSQAVMNRVWGEASQILDLSEEKGVGLIGWDDKGYPSRLRLRKDAPLLLYYRGNPKCLNGKITLGIVGTREPTYRGKKMAFGAGYFCAQRGIIMVSGLAKGCDQEAHAGTLHGQGQTVGVLPFGVERIQISGQQKITELMLENNGCLVSEYPPGTIPRINYFIARNRIITALSDKLLVVETGVKGGTMHTVRFALEDKKPIGCWFPPPEPLKQPAREGNQVIIEQGWALPLESSEDLDYFLKKVSS